MKTKQFIGLVMGLFFAFAIGQTATAQSKSSCSKKDCKVQFSVKSEKGLVDYATLTKSLQAEKGVKSVTAIEEKGLIEVAYNTDACNNANIIKAIKTMGYSASATESCSSSTKYNPTKKCCSKSASKSCNKGKK